jgi:hypothetical protein
MRGYHIMATDGEIGHADEFLVDDRTWAVRYLVVDTSNWIGGKSVLISSASVATVDSPNKKILVNLTRTEIQRSPTVDTAEIELVETLPAVWIM